MATKIQEEDFGFTFIDESEIDAEIKRVAEGAAEEASLQVETSYKDRLKQVENLVLPFLTNLTKDPQKVMIKWPNRAEVVDRQIQKLLKITRD
jgi:metal-dependent amidase/aminoacylase/carboxypeptidase family protein